MNNVKSIGINKKSEKTVPQTVKSSASMPMKSVLKPDDKKSETRKACSQTTKSSAKLPREPTIVLDDAEHEICQKIVRQRLAECGWSDQIKVLCKDVIKEKGSELTVAQLLEEVSRKAKDMLPKAIKRELMQTVKDHIEKTKSTSNTNSSGVRELSRKK